MEVVDVSVVLHALAAMTVRPSETRKLRADYQATRFHCGVGIQVLAL